MKEESIYKEGIILKMIKINENFLKLQDSYLFSTINRKIEEYLKENSKANIIRLGIGDVTRPIPNIVIEAIKKGVEEMGSSSTFKGYGPEQGYEFLRNKIVENEYANLQIEPDEVFVSDGAKCDTGNIVDLFAQDVKVAITDPVYPVYLDSNVMCGRSGKYDDKTGKYENIIYMPANEENEFEPYPEELEENGEIPDLIYICSPNNPTGIAMKRKTLEKWVEFAKDHHSVILFDAAYEAFIEEKDVPHSIYEIEGAKEVAIEFKSYSKTAGFTGLRCAYTIVPKQLEVDTKQGKISLNKLWNRRQTTKFNGVSYIVQRGAEAIYTEKGKNEVRNNIEYYKENAKIIKEGLKKAGIISYGGINSPYIWLKTPNNMKSWDYFDLLLEKYNIVGTPGVGFGPSGEGFFRLTAFGDREKTKEAMRRLKT